MRHFYVNAKVKLIDNPILLEGFKLGDVLTISAIEVDASPTQDVYFKFQELNQDLKFPARWFELK